MLVIVKNSVRVRSAEGTKVSRKVCAEMGRRGFKATTLNWFFGRTDYHKNWLRVKAAAQYAIGANRPGSIGGKFPPDIIHPAHLSESEAHFFLIIHTHPDNFSQYVPYMTDEVLHCIEACLYGCVRGRQFWSF